MKFRKTFWMNVMLFIMLLSASTRTIEVYGLLDTNALILSLSPLLTCITLGTKNIQKLNLVAIIFSGIYFAVGIFNMTMGGPLIGVLFACGASLINIIALVSLRSNQDLFFTARYFFISLLR